MKEGKEHSTHRVDRDAHANEEWLSANFFERDREFIEAMMRFENLHKQDAHDQNSTSTSHRHSANVPTFDHMADEFDEEFDERSKRFRHIYVAISVGVVAAIAAVAFGMYYFAHTPSDDTRTLAKPAPSHHQ